MLERVVAVALAAVLVAEVVYLADVLTNGAVGRAAAPHVAELRRVLREAAAAAEREREVRASSRWVIFEAIEATREGARNA